MIPFLPLQAINARFESSFRDDLNHLLDSGHYILGDAVDEFETAWAHYCGSQHCIGVGNGLDALTLILRGYQELGQLRSGDEVMVASNTYIATVLAVIQAGLQPVLVEAQTRDYNFDLEALKTKLRPTCRALVVTHLYGQLADMQALSAFAKANDLLLIDDCAQAHGAQNSEGIKAGNLCDASAFSFYPTKNLGALGDAGAVTTNDAALAALITQLRNYGFKAQYQATYTGMNSRLDAIQALFLKSKLSSLDADNERRRAIAAKYIDLLELPDLVLPEWSGGKDHVFHLFVVRHPKREALQQHLYNQGIETKVHYPVPPHQQLALSSWNYGSFPLTEQLCREVLSLPLHPLLSDETVEVIAATLNSWHV
ncbi:DegT/DnrJ/EryC1/StrS family aminotransferase [Croceiramulus getboli]|nr:DegT/DnrJ/EryC1/StrS family aminotransferase [Flavobacteriaceae bacterium YJPT1-3]